MGMRRRQRGAQRAARRRIAARRNEREAARRWEDGVRSTGAEADDGGRWAIAEIVSVWRPLPRRGRQLDVLVRWAGAAAEVTWEPISRRRFTPDQYALARRMETVRYGVQAGPPAVAVRAASRKTPRLAAAAAARRSAAGAAAAVGEGRSVRQRGVAAELSSDGEASSSPQAVSSDSGCSDSETSD